MTQDENPAATHIPPEIEQAITNLLRLCADADMHCTVIAQSEGDGSANDHGPVIFATNHRCQIAFKSARAAIDRGAFELEQHARGDTFRKNSSPTRAPYMRPHLPKRKVDA